MPHSTDHSTDPYSLPNHRRVLYARGQSRQERRRSVAVLVMLLLFWSLCLGLGLAQAAEPRTKALVGENLAQASHLSPLSKSPQELPDKSSADSLAGASPSIPGNLAIATADIGTVDQVPERYKTGQQLYLENCATCHIALPPAIMPTQTWKQLIQDAEHYGATIRPLGEPEVQIPWQYLKNFSRPLGNEEPVPYRIYQSRFFKALHPRVKFTQRVNLESCISCHPGAGKYDFRSLSAEWQNAP